MSRRLIGNRIGIFVTVALTLLGVGTFFQIPREEDPRIKKRNATATIVWPGATPEQIQRLIVRPIDDELLRVPKLKKFSAEIRPSVALYQLELLDSISDQTAIEAAWREIERGLDLTQDRLPSGVKTPILDFKVLEVESIVLALYHAQASDQADMVELLSRAKIIRDELRSLPGVAEVRLFGDPGDEVHVNVDVDRLYDQGLQILDVARTLGLNNLGTPPGYIANGKRVSPVAVDNDISLITSMKNIGFDTNALRTVTLGSFAEVKRVTRQPSTSYFRWNGKPAIGLGIVPKEQLNVVAFGDALLPQIDRIRATAPSLLLEYVAYQPKRTQDRLSELLQSLGAGMILVCVLLMMIEGVRAATIVTLCVPIISLISLFVYFLTNGVLHQISIAAFIISIGQFVDNIIVVNDQIQRRLNNGEDPSAAVLEVQKSLTMPLAFATLTAICAFLPMLAAQGSPADFIQALPLIAIIALIISYFVAIYFVPTLCKFILRPQVATIRKRLVDGTFLLIEKAFTKIAKANLVWIALIGFAITALSLWAMVHVPKEFFPESDRNEFILSFELPPSTDIRTTYQLVTEVEKSLLLDKRVQSIAAFAGGDMPRFYYNIPNLQRAPHVGQLLITTHKKEIVRDLGIELESMLKTRYESKYSGVTFTSQFLQQGPPINAKVEIKVFDIDPNKREEAAVVLEQLLADDSRLRSIRRDDHLGLEIMELQAKDDRIAQVNLSRMELKSLTDFFTSGLIVSEYRFARDLVPIRLQAKSAFLADDSSQLMQAKAIRGRDLNFKISDFANLTKKNVPSILRTENGSSYLRILADLRPGQTFPLVMEDLKKGLKDRQAKALISSSTRITFGGDAEGAEEANASIFKVVPLSMCLLLTFLLIEFNSFRKVLIVLLALPVTIIGVFPGLYLGGIVSGGIYFGFMSLLGLLALIGIAVNNMILLLEALEGHNDIAHAIGLRLRAIFLTTLLTLAGLIPLAIEDSPLWPPLAWTMISGLVTGTITTLIIVPALYRIFFRRLSLPREALALVLVFFAFLSVNDEAAAEDTKIISSIDSSTHYSIDEIINFSENSASYQASKARTQAAYHVIESTKIKGWTPSLLFGGEGYQRQHDLEVESARGSAKVEDKSRIDAKIELRQPLYKPTTTYSALEAVKSAYKATDLSSKQLLRESNLKYGTIALALIKLEEREEFFLSILDLLSKRERFITRLINRGRGSRSDLVRIDLAREKSQQGLRDLEQERTRLSSLLIFDLNLSKKFSIKTPETLGDVQGMIQQLLSSDLSGDQSNVLQLLALDARSQELQSRHDQVLNARLPSIEAFGRVLHAEGKDLNRKTWPELGIALQWEVPITSLRREEAREILERRQEVLSLRQSAASALAVERATLAKTLANTLVRSTNLEKLIKKTADMRDWEKSEYEAGRINLQTLIEADQTHLETRLDLALLKWETLEYCLKARETLGLPILGRCK
jgi:multidrug efflux pump subunit AcrB